MKEYEIDEDKEKRTESKNKELNGRKIYCIFQNCIGQLPYWIREMSVTAVELRFHIWIASLKWLEFDTDIRNKIDTPDAFNFDWRMTVDVHYNTMVHKLWSVQIIESQIMLHLQF